MLGYGNCLRVSMPRMESLPESSQPHGDLVKKDRKLRNILTFTKVLEPNILQ
jgi:hypothetical protein